jgi:hypothetical protein
MKWDWLGIYRRARARTTRTLDVLGRPTAATATISVYTYTHAVDRGLDDSRTRPRSWLEPGRSARHLRDPVCSWTTGTARWLVAALQDRPALAARVA